MAYDDADNRINDATAGYVTSDGHVLYVYDTTSESADAGGAYAFAGDATGTTGHVGYAAAHDLARTNVGADEDDIYDSFSALFLAYDAADDAYALDDDFDDDFDEDEDVSAGTSSVGNLDLDDLAAAFGLDDELSTDDSHVVTEPTDDRPTSAARPASPRHSSPAGTGDVMQRYDVSVDPVVYGGAGARRDGVRSVSALDDVAAGNPEAEAALAALKVRNAQARRKRGVYVLLMAGVAAVAVLAVFVNYLLGLDEAVAAVAGGVATASRGDLALTVSSTGTAEPISSVAVLPSVSGVVDEVYVSEGDLVEEGNILFTVTNDELASAAEDARDALDAANGELTRANEDVVAAYERYNDEVDSYQAGQNPTFDEGRLQEDISAAEAVRDRALANATAARDALEAANARAAARDVTAPATGAVMRLAVSPGDVVGELGSDAPSAEVPMRIADVSQLRVTAWLSGEQAVRVSVGQAAVVVLAALPSVASEGVVESVATQPLVGADGMASYAVSVLVDSPDSRLRPGAETSVTITTAVLPDVLTVPADAISTDEDGVTSVWVVTDEATGRSEKRSVVVGAREGGSVVVSEGLADGDMVGLP